MGQIQFISCIYCLLELLNFCYGLTYTVVEQGLSNEFIGNIGQDFNFSVTLEEEKFKNLRYSFLNQNSPKVKYFNISENTGDLISNGILDREIVCEFEPICNISLQVAVQNSREAFFKKVKFSVLIVDINDNSPEFGEKSIDLSISESVVIGTEINIDGASDPDQAENSVKSYEVSTPDSPFSANFTKNLDGSTTVQLIVEKELDRETMDNYQIEIVASDGARSGTLLVNVTITDTNDNPPVFSQKEYNVTVKEDIAINSSVLQVRAIDNDIGENGAVTYELKQSASSQIPDIKDLFTIEPKTGKLRTIGRLAYSPGKPYEIIVEASDSGVQPHTAQAKVFVHVQDVENNPPKIDINYLSSYNFSKISEFADQGAVVALIGVKDDDIGWNGITNCSVKHDVFKLERSEANEYQLTVAKPLDREKVSHYTVTVACQDIGTPPQKSSRTFDIVVTDENDHAPVFSMTNYVQELTENNNYGDIIVTVSATDSDIGKNSKIHYALLGDAWSNFMINSDTGDIMAMKSFDREDKEFYEFHVLAVDGGEEPQTATATVSLTILDVNDNTPRFIQSYYEFEVAENQPKGLSIGDFIAEDPDGDANGIVTYSIAEKFEITVPFKLLPNGTLQTKVGLDREFHSSYDFTVVATDQGSPHRLNSSVNVSVFVSDINDNSPIIRSPEKSGYVIHLTLSTPINTPLYQVKAHDLDDGKNGELTFVIEERNDTHIFDINDSGHILVSRPMDVKEVNDYEIQVVIYDKGNPRNSAKTKLIMSVTVSNVTDVTGTDGGMQSQNLLIALTVVIVTVVLAATIVITILVIKCVDRKNKDSFYGDTNSDRSSDMEVVPGLIMESQKDYYSRPNNNLQLAPVVSHTSLNQGSNKDYIYKPRMDTPTPSSHSVSGDDVQLHEVSPEARDTSTPRLNRLASLRLHQALLQSHDKQWTNHNDSQQSEMYSPKPAEDSHSQMSGDTGDSGRGGSVSDGHSNMGISHESDDLRIMQLQHIVRQSGRRGTPPHLQKDISHYRGNIEELPTQSKRQSNLNESDQLQKDIEQYRTNLEELSNNQSKRLSNLNQSDLHLDQSKGSKYLDSEKCQSEIVKLPQRLNYSRQNSISSLRGKQSPGIQMGLSSFSNHQSPQLASFKSPVRRQPSHDNYNPHMSKYDRQNSHHSQNHFLNETMDSLATTAYDDDDNTTTSGSYTIDNNAAEDFIELNVAQLKDMFV